MYEDRGGLVGSIQGQHIRCNFLPFYIVRIMKIFIIPLSLQTIMFLRLFAGHMDLNEARVQHNIGNPRVHTVADGQRVRLICNR